MTSENQDNNSTSTKQSVMAETLIGGYFPIVGIGASAGGLEAFEGFFKACPADTGMSFVLVSHLSPDHQSLLSEILQRRTSMPVTQVIDQNKVEPNHVYVIPPDRDMIIHNCVLHLSKSEVPHGQRLPIDCFFRSLADEQAERAVGIILSGTASDGTLGLRAILGVGGVCMVQTPATAKYDGMPQSAINAGYATHILNVEAMPAILIELSRQSAYRMKVPQLLTNDKLNSLNQILQQIRNITGHNFSLYKKSTITRRIERRMALHHINDFTVYLRFLKKSPSEVHTLFKELLINVTSFFRDAEAFAVLKRDILPALLVNKPEDYVIRVWVAGCASGEEAYSIAMVLREWMDEAHQYFKVQIYATDLDELSINRARTGSYLVSIEQDVTPERLKRFFTADDYGYRINKDIREMVVFAVQSVIKDPPFTRLDLLSCRNLMIYLEQEQQDKLIPIFHYALKPNGVLLLSNSESIANHTSLFKPLNRKWKFYQASKTATKLSLTAIGSLTMPPPTTPEVQKILPAKKTVINVADLSNRMLLNSYAPASVTTDAMGNILYVHGDTNRYLRTPSGPVTTNVVEMAHNDLHIPLETALQAAMQGESTLSREVTLNTRENVLRMILSLRLLPLPTSESNADERLRLISFQELPRLPTAKRGRSKLVSTSEEHRRIELLERNLAYASEKQQAVIDEQQATNEELKSANEELQSTNEELQSSNEELETSKEELQSLNEETITVNSELNSKIEQLSVLQNDLKNLMDSVNTGIVFLDYHLNIRSYTREAVKAYCLIASDVGRPLSDITSNLQGESLLVEMHKVLATLIPCEREVQSKDGAWYLARMQPYRTLDHTIDGLVISLTDIDTLHKAEAEKLNALQLLHVLSQGIVDTVIEPLIIMDADLQVISASRAFFQHFKVTPEETVGHKIYTLGNGQWDIPALRDLLEDILPKRQTMEGFEMEHKFPELGMRHMVLNARRIKTELGDTELILLAMVTIENKESP
jgi:two-component system CheB/CheR fusion protein